MPIHNNEGELNEADSIIKSQQIAKLIDEVWDAVAQSKVGPIKRDANESDILGNPNIKQGMVLIDNIAMQTFVVMLNNLVPKSMQAKMDLIDEHDK